MEKFYPLLSELRQRLGCSQEELALILGVSRSTLAMAENFYRDKPFAMSRRIRIIQSQLESGLGPEPIEAAKLEHLLERHRAELDRYLARQEQRRSQEQQRLQARLARMEKAYADALSHLEYLLALRPDEIPDKYNAPKYTIHGLIAKKMIALERNSPAKQAKLREKTG